MGYQLLVFLAFLLGGIAFCCLCVSVLGRLLRPQRRAVDEPFKGETYECGEPPMGSSWVRFNPRFYTLALVFLVFDVEVAFLYPWALVFRAFRRAGAGLTAFFELAVFLGVLAVGLAYCWRKGDLEWQKAVESSDDEIQGGRA